MNAPENRQLAALRAQLMAWLLYDGDTGRFTWNAAPVQRIPAGSVAGGLNSEGYRVVRCMGVLYLSHRLAWLFCNGSWPSGDIDHINGVRDDNRIENLRDVSRSVNQQNLKRARRDNATGLLGVKRARKGFEARINVSGRYVHLGTFSTPTAAHAAYLAAKRQHHEGCTL